MVALLKSCLQNFRCPRGVAGKLAIWGMNLGHAKLAQWGRSHLLLAQNSHILDIGCGGGTNIEALLHHCPHGKVCGLDHSLLCVVQSCERNAKAIEQGRCAITHGDVSQLPYAANSFDVVTAFETVYFWSNVIQAFKQVHTVLKPGGLFLICNEASDPRSSRCALIEGMQIYSNVELVSLLKGAGFSEVSDDTTKDGALCVVAQKASAQPANVKRYAVA